MKKKNFLTLLLIFSIVLLVPFLVQKQDVKGQENSITEYDYVITPEQPEWKNYTVPQLRKKLIIPQETLSKMTEKCLYETLMKYPFLCDFGAFATVPEGSDPVALEKFKEHCSVYQEIVRRGLTLSELSASYANKIQTRSRNLVKDFNEDFVADIMETEKTLDSSLPMKVATRVAYTTVKTPRGTNVSVLSNPDSRSASTRAAEGRQYANIYNVEYIGPSNTTYNCHSYAWYWSSQSNPYWMRNPSAYMSDGSYRKGSVYSTNQMISNSDIRNGQIIYYNSGDHSGVVTGINVSPTNAVANVTVTSKFGSLGLYRHTLGNCPYNTSSISNWR